MVVLKGQREDENSAFKYLLVSALRVCDPDTVLISSGFYANRFWECKMDTILLDLLKNKDIELCGKSSYINRLANDLGNDLGDPKRVNAIQLHPDADWHRNEIYFIKKDRICALIVGSSSCTKRDLDIDDSDPQKASYNLNTDIMICDDAYAKDIDRYFFGDRKNGERPGIFEDFPDLNLEKLPVSHTDNLLDEMARNTRAQINKYR